MKNSNGTDNSSLILRLRRAWSNIWHWLIEPSPAVVETERRLQAGLLMAMLLVLIILGVLSLILMQLESFVNVGESKEVTTLFIWIILIGIALLIVEYALSRSIHYRLAALLTVGTVLASTFVTVIVNPQDLRSTSFLVLGGLVGSLFLSVRTTAIIFLGTFLGLLLLPAFVPGFTTASDVNALFFILTVGGLVVMASTLRQRYLQQIDRQTQQLLESEARLRELSIRDPLTGLFNRRYLEEMLTVEMMRAARKQYPIGVIMADIDHFKRLNDAHGHATGDAVLVEVSKLLRTHVRASDVTCRYGGEEFIIILPEASREITQMRAEHMREDVSHLHVRCGDQTLETVTLSLGVAIFPNHGSTYDAVLGTADAAMYRAKSDGRNRVVVADE